MPERYKYKTQKKTWKWLLINDSRDNLSLKWEGFVWKNICTMRGNSSRQNSSMQFLRTVFYWLFCDELNLALYIHLSELLSSFPSIHLSQQLKERDELSSTIFSGFFCSSSCELSEMPLQIRFSHRHFPFDHNIKYLLRYVALSWHSYWSTFGNLKIKNFLFYFEELQKKNLRWWKTKSNHEKSKIIE